MEDNLPLRFRCVDFLFHFLRPRHLEAAVWHLSSSLNIPLAWLAADQPLGGGHDNCRAPRCRRLRCALAVDGQIGSGGLCGWTCAPAPFGGVCRTADTSALLPASRLVKGTPYSSHIVLQRLTVTTNCPDLVLLSS